MKLLGENSQMLWVERSEWGCLSTPGERDLLLNVSVTVQRDSASVSYSASDQCWVLERDLLEFLVQLRALERQRQGRADLVGMSPEDFRLTVAATDASGHMSVSGHVGWWTPHAFRQRMEFGFPFDPGLLATVVREFGALAK